MATVVEPSVLVNSVMGKIFDVLTNGDETVPQSEDNFFSWASPGIPIEEEDLDFLTQGLTGVVKRAAIEELVGVGAGGGTGTAPAAAPVELTPELLDQLRAEDTGRMYMQAENLARLVDFVPDVTRATNDQFARLNILNNEGTLSEIYRYVLRMSQVVQTELPEETKKQIEEFRKLLSVTKTKKNLIDGTETQVSEPSELTRVYNEKLAAYEATALEYNSRRVDALAATNSKAIHFWSVNANILRNRVRAAMSDWISNGYKNDYEQISAFIDQVMQRDMALLKQEYRDDLEKARLTSLTGNDFFFTSLVPGNVGRAAGWTEFTFSSGDFQSQSASSYATRRWQASGGGGFLGIFGGGGGGGGSSSREESHHQFSLDRFYLRFEIAQVPIVRPWFKQGFLLSKSWRFDQNNPEAKSEIVSDAGTPPKGLIPAYPTTAIFVRNLHMFLGHSEGFSDWMTQHTSSRAGGGGFVNFGPFHIGGSYSRASTSGRTEQNRGNSWDNEGLHIDGMQVVGFKCHILPKSPNPLPNITAWI